MRYKNVFGIGYSIIIIISLINVTFLSQNASFNHQEETVYMCALCQEEVDIFNLATLSCHHSFCRECIVVGESTTSMKSCPHCRNKFNDNDNEILGFLKQDPQFFPARFDQVLEITSGLGNSLSELKEQFYLYTGQSGNELTAIKNYIGFLEQRLAEMDGRRPQVQQPLESLDCLSKTVGIHTAALEELKKTVLKDSESFLLLTRQHLTSIRTFQFFTKRIEALEREKNTLKDGLVRCRKQIDENKTQQAIINTSFARDNTAWKKELACQQRQIDSMRRNQEKRIGSKR